MRINAPLTTIVATDSPLDGGRLGGCACYRRGGGALRRAAKYVRGTGPYLTPVAPFDFMPGPLLVQQSGSVPNSGPARPEREATHGCCSMCQMQWTHL
jgi:hypothetical protein